MLATRARDDLVFVVYCNLVGGQDELLFDGASVVIAPDGRVLARGGGVRRGPRSSSTSTSARRSPRACATRGRGATSSRSHADVVLPPRRPARAPPLDRTPREPPASVEAELWGALRVGLRDYVEKNGFRRVLIGLSGGIDSALVAALAADALGAERVECVSLPTRFNVAETRSDARLVAERLGVAFRELPIEDLRTAFGERLPEHVRPRGREPAGADPRRAPDDALEPARLARPDDLEQVRDGGRLRDPLRRHGRRLRAAARRAEDDGVPRSRAT